MYEYVKRTDVIAEIKRGDLLVGNFAEWAEEIVWRTPYSDVEPVNHSYWMECSHFGHTTYICYNCKHGSAEKTNYCPDCGAKMNMRY